MSFSPLPELFLDYLLGCKESSGRVLDLGCGDGAFSLPLASYGVDFLGLDRRGPEAGTVAAVVGDVQVPPLRPGSQDLVVAANLFRHIVRGDPQARFLDRWKALLKPGGALFIFEDEPSEKPGAAGNYRNFQDFLFRLMPEGRGPLLAKSTFEHSFGPSSPEGGWVFGSCRNEMEPDQGLVLEMLSGQSGNPTGEIIRLKGAIERDGLAYGDFWWACWPNDSG